MEFINLAPLYGELIDDVIAVATFPQKWIAANIFW